MNRIVTLQGLPKRPEARPETQTKLLRPAQATLKSKALQAANGRAAPQGLRIMPITLRAECSKSASQIPAIPN